MNMRKLKSKTTQECLKMALAVGPQETKQELIDGGQLQTVVPESGKSGMRRDVLAKWN